jgi:hypothetical protein
MKEININSSTVFYTDKFNGTDLGHYYNYILQNIIKVLKSKKNAINVNFTEENISCCLNLWFNYEHTIIKEGDKLIPRIAYYDLLNRMDFVFEYSNTNIEHLNHFTEYNDFSKKLIYTPPLYELNSFSLEPREKLITTIHNPSPRRVKFFNLNYDNIYGVYDISKIYNITKDYKILLNIHQTNQHLTLEELRIVPLLFSNILIVSEKSPYIETLPYYKHIVWVEYDEIEDKIKDIENNYKSYIDFYHKDINETFKFMSDNINPKFEKIFNTL